MALIPRPPHTGNDELDSVLTYLVDRINDGVTQPGTGPQGPPGTGGDHGNTSIYLYTRAHAEIPVPTRPNSVDYDFSDINAPVTVNDENSPWSTDIPSEGGDYLWVTFRYVAGESGEIRDATSWDTPALLSVPGDAAPRRANGYVYTADVSVPDAPETKTDSTSFDWDTGVLTTPPTNWSLNAPDNTTMGQQIYVAYWTAAESDDFVNTTVTYADPVLAQVVLNDVKSPNYDGATGEAAMDNPGTQGYYLNAEMGMVVANDVMIPGLALTVQEDGTALETAANVLNFTGPGVTVSGDDATKTITIAGGGTTGGDTGHGGQFVFGRRLSEEPDRHFIFGRRVS